MEIIFNSAIWFGDQILFAFLWIWNHGEGITGYAGIATVGTLIIIIYQITKDQKQKRIDRSFQLINRYFDTYHLPMMRLKGNHNTFSRLIAAGLIKESKKVEDIDEETLYRTYVQKFFNEIGINWINNRIDKETLKVFMGKEIVNTYKYFGEEISKVRETNKDKCFLIEWKIMLNEIENPKLEYHDPKRIILYYQFARKYFLLFIEWLHKDMK